MRVLTSIRWPVAAAALCATAACASRAQAPSSTYAEPAAEPVETRPAPARASHDMIADCPMDVAGASVTAENIDGGIALVFTTQSGEVVELRGRIARLADNIDQPHAGTSTRYPGSPSTTAPGTAPATPGTPPPSAGPIPPTTISPAPGNTTPARRTFGDTLTGNIAVKAEVVELPDGARLELRADSSADVEPLRARARENAVQMASGMCPGIDKAG